MSLQDIAEHAQHTNINTTPDERLAEADTHRVRGELLITIGDAVAAEKSFYQAQLPIGRLQTLGTTRRHQPRPPLPLVHRRFRHAGS